jgi:hypothetical protein
MVTKIEGYIEGDAKVKSLNERVLLSILTQLDVMKAKRSVISEKGLETNLLDDRIVSLEAALNLHQKMMMEDKENE